MGFPYSPQIASFGQRAMSGLGTMWNGTQSPVMQYPEGYAPPMLMGPQAPTMAAPEYMAAPNQTANGSSFLNGYGGGNSGPGQMPADMGTMGTAGTGGLKGWLGNGQNLGVAIQGFGTLAQAYLGFQAMKQAKEGLKFQKEAFNTNMNNSISTFNTSLEDRIRGRTSNYEGKENDVSSYLAKHSLKRA